MFLLYLIYKINYIFNPFYILNIIKIKKDIEYLNKK